MADEIRRVADVLSAPMEQVIVALGTAIGRAQRELDRFAIQTQREINEDPTLAENGLQPTFYQIPRAELELTTAIVLEDESSTTPVSPPPAVGPAVGTIVKGAALRRVHLQPVNAAYANQFNFDVHASSRVKLTIVPVPPPAADGAVTPRLSQEEVVKIASAKLVTATNVRLAVNFNGQTRLWFVVQYQNEGDTTRRLALVVVDDETRQIVKAEA
jgi:hypothetical protein